MKKYILVIKSVMLYSCLIYSTTLKAQYSSQSPQFGTDIKVSHAIAANNMSSKIKVADNGWIYILDFYEVDVDSKQWDVYCSKDHGLTYKLSFSFGYETAAYDLQDVDFAVIGHDSASISIFVAEAITQGVLGGAPSRCQVEKFDVSGSLTKVVYEYDWSGKTVTHVAITDDHRYPSLNSSFPISIGVVWVGGDAAASEDHLTYAISNDGGETFTNHFMYNQVWPGRLGKASISMGANSDTGPGLVGVAFEKNLIGSVWGDIGVIVNYYDLSREWTVPITIGEGDFASINMNPTISLRQASAGMPSADHFSLIAGYEHQGANVISQACYALMDYTYFYYGCPQAQPTDLTYHYINPGTSYSTTELNFNYNIHNDQYYLTYLTTDNYQFHFSTIEADPLSALMEKATFRDISSYIGWPTYPCVDSNPITGLAYFSWTDAEDGIGENVYTDSEASALGVNERVTSGKHLLLYPSPAMNQVTVEFQGTELFTVALTDLMGKEVLSRPSCSNKCKLDVSGLRPGIYQVRVSDRNSSEVQKLIIQ